MPTSRSSTRSPQTRSRSVASSGDSLIRAAWSPATRRVRLVTSRVSFVQRCLSTLPKVCHAGADGATPDRPSPPITGTDEQPPPCPGSRPGAPAGAPGTWSSVLTSSPSADSPSPGPLDTTAALVAEGPPCASGPLLRPPGPFSLDLLPDPLLKVRNQDLPGSADLEAGELAA